MVQCVTWPDPRGLLSKDAIVSLSWRVIRGIFQLLARVLSMKLPAASINAELLCQPLPQKKYIIVENPAKDRGSVIYLVSAPLYLDEKYIFPKGQGNEFENAPVHHSTDIAATAYICPVQIVISDFFLAAWVPLWKEAGKQVLDSCSFGL